MVAGRWRLAGGGIERLGAGAWLRRLWPDGGWWRGRSVA